MEKGNTLYYHGHIISSIDKLNPRKDIYIARRLQFLQQFCQPIRHRINGIKEDIKYYENMRDTQYEVIESEPDIMALKKQIREYTETKGYFEAKLDQYDRITTQLEERNKIARVQLDQKRQQYKLVNGGIAQKTLTSVGNPSQVRGLKREKSILGTTIGIQQEQESYKSRKTEGYYQSLENADKETQKLPKIITHRKPLSKYYVFNQSKIRSQHQKLQKSRRGSLYSYQYNSISHAEMAQPKKDTLNPENPQPEQQPNFQKIKELISQFDRTESLFRDCFQRKKISIQKSVSQLQSRLITNKQLFLKACQVIGEKQGEIPLQDFMELSSDQLITLFISFSWLNRKIYGDLQNKRKNLLGLSKKLKNGQSF